MSGTQQNSHSRITFLTTGLGTGGAETMLYKLLSGIDRDLFDPAVVVLMEKERLGRQLEDIGVPVTALNLPRGWPTPSGLIRLVSALRDLQPQLVQGWMYHANLAASVAAPLLGSKVPVIWNIRHTPYKLKDYKRSTATVIRLGARLSHQPRRIIYNAHKSASRHQALGYHSRKAIVIPNGFDTQVFKPDPEAHHELHASLNLDIQIPLIGMVARYHPMKDHANFLRAAAILHQQHPGVYYILIGRGIDEQNIELTNIISSLGLTEFVHLLGERSDIASILPGLDIATLTSAWGEGFPNVIGEAMACGIPCVVTDIGDSASLVADTGIVVPAQDPVSLSRAWQQLLELPTCDWRDLGLQARSRIIQNFTLTSIADQYQALYCEVLQE